MNAIHYKALEEPGLTGAALSALAVLVLRAFASYGLALTPETEELITYVLALSFPFIAAFIARYMTTPLVRPMDSQGNTLTPEV